MFQKLLEIIKQNGLDLNPEDRSQYIYQMLAIIYSSGVGASARFQEMNESATDENDLNFLIEKELNVDLMNMLAEKLAGNNLSGLINGYSDIAAAPESMIAKITNPQILTNQHNKQNELAELTFKTVFKTALPQTMEQIADTLSPEIYFSKQDIASEFGVDKKTLNKWLAIIYPDNRFHARKRLNVLEYKEIFEKLFLAHSESKLNLSEHIKFYTERVKNGLNFSKGDLLEMTGSDYKTLRDNASRAVPNFAALNLFPYSLAMKIMEKMGEPLLFAPTPAGRTSRPGHS